MTLPQQYFVPLVTNDRRCLGTLPCSLTTFNGTETAVSVTYGGNLVTFPSKLISYTDPRNLSTFSFMSIYISPTEERLHWRDQSRLLNAITTTRQWYDGSIKYLKSMDGDLVYFLKGNVKIAAAPTVTPPALTGNNVSQNWNYNSPFSNIDACEFFEINWIALGNFNPATVANVSIGAATSDPSSGTALKAMVVQTYDLNVVNNNASYSTIRIVRVNKGNAVPSGTYTWNLSVGDIYGQTTTISLSVVQS